MPTFVCYVLIFKVTGNKIVILQHFTFDLSFFLCEKKDKTDNLLLNCEVWLYLLKQM